jgi:DUF4097 and DUF4098 domain-containing protein YvlB
MLRSVLFSALGVSLLAVPEAAQGGDGTLRREGSRWVQSFSGTANLPGGARLRIVGQGPVTVTADPSGQLRQILYSVDVKVKAPDERQARTLLEFYRALLASGGGRLAESGGWYSLQLPRFPSTVTLTVRLPRGGREVVVSTSDGDLEIGGLECPLRAETGAGWIRVDRISAPCNLYSGGGEIRVGSVGGPVTAATGGGPITVRSVRGSARLQTGGGDITADEIAGAVRANTGGGSVRIREAGSSVDASTGGGGVVVDRAQGIVTVSNAGGPVQVGASAGVRCQTAAGAVRLANVNGAMRVVTAMGSINASLLGGKLAESYLSTGNGDITVTIPSNLGLTIRAENEMADTIRRIVSEFPGIPVRLRGSQVVAEGAINGGGPLLRISGTGGTIFILRHQ